MPLVVARQVMLSRPILDLQRIAVGSPIAVVTIAIALLQELLILAFQVVLEDDAVDVWPSSRRRSASSV